MAQARVGSIDALKSFRTALIRFAEDASLALADAESEVVRTLSWLDNEQTVYWQSEVRKRTEQVTRCQDAVRQKRIFKDAAGRPQSAIEEEKTLKLAIQRLEEATFKVQAVRKAIRQMEKEVPLYKGMVQRLGGDLVVSVPTAAAHLENLIRTLEAYTSLGAPGEVTSTAVGDSEAASGGREALPSMARAVEEEQKPDESPKPDEG